MKRLWASMAAGASRVCRPLWRGLRGGAATAARTLARLWRGLDGAVQAVARALRPLQRVVVRLTKVALWLLPLLLALMLVAHAWVETQGLPGWAANYVAGRLAEQGVRLEAEGIRAGLLRGVTLDQARLRFALQDVPVIVTCNELRLRLDPRALRSRRPALRSASFDGASVALYLGPVGPPGSERAALRLERCRGDAQRQRDGAMVLTLDGLAEKIALHLDVDLRGLEARGRHAAPPPPPTASAEAPAPVPAGAPESPPAPATEPWRLRAELARLATWLGRARLAERDAFLSGRLTLDLEHPEANRFHGDLGIAELTIGDLSVPHLKSRLHYRAPELRLEDLTVVLGQGQTLTAEVVLDLAAQTARGRLHGQILPDTLRRLPLPAAPAWTERLLTTLPVDVEAELATSPWQPSSWQISGTLRARNLAMPGLAVSRLEGRLAWDGQILRVDPWRAELDAAATEYAEGSLAWYASDRTLEGRIEGRCSLGERLRQAGLTTRLPALRQVAFASPVTLQVSLERSSLDWRRLRAAGSIGTATIGLHGREVGPLAATWSLAEAVLRLEKATVGLRDAPADAVAVQASVDLDQALASGVWAAPFGLRCQALAEPADPHGAAPAAPAAAPPAWQDGVALDGTLRWTPSQGRVEIQAEGNGYPGRWYDTAVPRLGLPASDIVHGIRCAPGLPAQVTLSAGRDDARQPWRLHAQVAGREARYGDLTLRAAQGTIDLTSRRVAFTDIVATTADGDDLSLDLTLDFKPLAVTIRNARIVGRPELIATFIDHRESRRFYQRVWQDVRWHDAQAATIDLHHLAYRKTPGGRDWTLTLAADLQAGAMSYRNQDLTGMRATVELDLPEKVVVREARITTANAALEGEVTVFTDSNPRCTFALRQAEGGQDPAVILDLIHPEWGRLLGPLAFSPSSAVDCRGSFYLGREPRLQLNGSLQAPWMEAHGLRLEAATADWRLSQSALHWDLTAARLFGGTVATTGLYDLETGFGKVAIRGDGMALKDLSAHLDGQGESSTSEGVVQAHCNLEILRGWAGRDLQVYGDGVLNISEADLWRVPLFDPLARLLDVSFLSRLTGGRASGLGRITRLDADLAFTGDRVAVRSLTTDGTILSLRGAGEYCWETDRIALAVSGQALDNAGLVGWIFRPLSWAFFNAELSGTAKDHRWRLSTAFNRALPGGGGDNPAEATP